jgi:hypothetical protein
MTFEELLDQAIALLQRRGRLTYRALKRQFDLDEAYLEDLKTELIKGQRLKPRQRILYAGAELNRLYPGCSISTSNHAV